MIVMRPLFVRRNVHRVEPDLALLYADIPFTQRGSSRAQTFDLGPEQLDARLELFQNVELVAGLAVPGQGGVAVLGFLGGHEKFVIDSGPSPPSFPALGY